QSPLLTGLSPFFLMPHSRHTEVRRHDIEAHAYQGLQLLAFGPESGVGLVASADLRRVFVSGHLEYEPYTLHNEYHRDLRKGLPIAQPEHYYDEAEHVIFSWKTDALQFYRNWVLWVKHHAHDNDL
ncbi:MAG: homoserine O-succinyltransferase, partial [Bacteroidales bacterium]|nr:homoserine O-succinyltransferase [Bacteroidales bacterium]